MALGISLLLALPFLVMLYQVDSPFFSRQEKREKERSFVPFAFSLGLSQIDPVLPIPDIQGEMTFSFDPPRPEGTIAHNRLLVRLKKSAESKRVILPCRLDLEFQKDRLVFAKESSPFWIELTQSAAGQIEVKGSITSLGGERMDAGTFLVAAQESPLQTASEFSEGSPFRLLAETRWWGRDLFRDQGSGERLELGSSELLELKEGDWLVWKGQKWEKGAAPEKEAPIAHIQSCSTKALVLEGWDSQGHIRVALNPAVGSPFKVKGEELFSAIRIRSEKQISCMLEKQCLVLKTGDWVLKTGGRWKILRKGQEREAVLNGKMAGELFVFDQISQKQGQKMIQGRLFNLGRTQMVAIEMAAHSARKVGDKGAKRGK